MALIAAHLNAGRSGGDSVAIGNPPPHTHTHTHLHTPFPPFSPSLISLMVSVDVKHPVYLGVREAGRSATRDSGPESQTADSGP